MNYALTLADKVRSFAITIADLDAALAIAKQKLEALETEAEGEASLDASLKNDKQRTYAAFKALQVNPEYDPLIENIRQLSHDRAVAQAELEFNRNQLSLSKLAEKSRIAQRLEQSELADLVAS